MGTRSTYRVIESFQVKEAYGKYKVGQRVKQNISLTYVQYDGYPSGHPRETAAWLASGKVVNGISSHDTGLIFNGAGCLAAQLVARLKTGPGGVYMYPVNNRQNCGESYLYDIVVDAFDMKITFIAYENSWEKGRKPIKLFEGTPEEYEKFIRNELQEA